MHCFQNIIDISQILILQIEDMNEDCFKIARPYLHTFREIRRQRALRSGPFIFLNDSASPKMVKKVYFNCFRFFLNRFRAV